MEPVILSIDAGTSSVRIFAFNQEGEAVERVSSEFTQHFPKPGWVEHDAAEIWTVTRTLLDEMLTRLGDREVAGIGITNQRETTVLWDRTTGEPVGRAIVWQCRRTAPLCSTLKEQGHEPLFNERTGLVLDAYFSGTKVKWLLDHHALHTAAESGDVRFGTIDSWLVFKLTGGARHITDTTNASRTLLYNIHEREWDPELLDILGVPAACLPEVHSPSEIYGKTAPEVTGGRRIPIAGIAGDQQAALFGQGAVHRGLSKNTYGTGCFALVNLGHEPATSENGLLLTLACDANGKTCYALEGSVFVAGAAIQWLRDELQLVESAEESERIALSVDSTDGIYVVPAFVGLGAPYWDADARGAILGLTRGTNRAHIVRGALEGIAYQTKDLMEAFEADMGEPIREMRVDGGAADNSFLMQFQADILGTPILRPRNTETTVLGAAYLAGLATDFWPSFEAIRELNPIAERFVPDMTEGRRTELYDGWKRAVRRIRTEETR